MPAPDIPPPPKPRTDLSSAMGETPEQYQEYVQFLAETPVDAWRAPDGTIYLLRMAAAVAPAVGMVDSPMVLTPQDPSYNEWSTRLEPEYDFMVPTKVTPQPRQPHRAQPQPPQQEEEVPDAASADHDAEAG